MCFIIHFVATLLLYVDKIKPQDSIKTHVMVVSLVSIKNEDGSKEEKILYFLSRKSHEFVQQFGKSFDVFSEEYFY